MATDAYIRANKQAKKEFQIREASGEDPYLEVMESILPSKDDYSEVSLGLIMIPLDRIVGTAHAGRSNAFAANFMPLLDAYSEFANKWSVLEKNIEAEGLREPIKAYEFMNKFYVVEGNKRVSVSKFLDTVDIPAEVTRIVTKPSEDFDNKLYHEYIDFYNDAHINLFWFSELGGYSRIYKALGKTPGERWDEDDSKDLASCFIWFDKFFKQNGGEDLNINSSDAFLKLLELYAFDELREMGIDQLHRTVSSIWEDIRMLKDGEQISLHLEPENDKKHSKLTHLFSAEIPHRKVGFVYVKNPEDSAWTYCHELGRIQLEEADNHTSTVKYENVTEDTIDEVLEQAVADGCNVIFTTSPSFVNASVKAAIKYPKVKFLNCSVNTKHKYIRTYYARMYEAKFIMGAIAGSLAYNNRIAYFADYPIYGTVAEINAFCAGAKMTNPSVEVHLAWTSMKDFNIHERLWCINPSIVSGKDMIIPGAEENFYGLNKVVDGKWERLAMPLYQWGEMYEKIIKSFGDGSFKMARDEDGDKAINYWWGLNAGVVDVICSKNLPNGTVRLVNLLKETIKSGVYGPFKGVLYSQEGPVIEDENSELTPEEIMSMDWLSEVVVGKIPDASELVDSAISTVEQQGVKEV